MGSCWLQIINMFNNCPSSPKTVDGGEVGEGVVALLLAHDVLQDHDVILERSQPKRIYDIYI